MTKNDNCTIICLVLVMPEPKLDNKIKEKEMELINWFLACVTVLVIVSGYIFAAIVAVKMRRMKTEISPKGNHSEHARELAFWSHSGIEFEALAILLDEAKKKLKKNGFDQKLIMSTLSSLAPAIYSELIKLDDDQEFLDAQADR